MNNVVLAVRLVLAAVFVVAAVGKAADLAGSRRAVHAFGVPRVLASLIGTLLPLAEFGVAIALVFNGAARWGALSAFVLLVMLSAAVARLIAKGSRPDCHCFGQLHSEPIGIVTVCRNVFLALAAGFVVLAGAGARNAGFARHPGALAAVMAGALLLCVIALQARFSYRLLRRHGQLLTQIEELKARLPATGLQTWSSNQPAVTSPLALSLPAYDGSTRSLAELVELGSPLLLVFSDPGCQPCAPLLPDLSRWQAAHAEVFRIVVITRGSSEANHASLSTVGAAAVLGDHDRRVMRALEIPGTPAAIFLDRRGQPLLPAALGADAIRRTVGEAVARAEGARGGSDSAQDFDFSSSPRTATPMEVAG